MQYKEKTEYTKYLQSKEWKKIRQDIFEKRNGVCEMCNQKIEKGFHVHHINYDNWGKEQEQDLMLLCKNCHEEMHHRGKSKNYVILGRELLTSKEWLSLNYASQAIYINMKLWAGNKTTFCYSYSLAKNIVSSHTTIKKAFDELVEKKLISVEKSKGKGNIYSFIR